MPTSDPLFKDLSGHSVPGLQLRAPPTVKGKFNRLHLTPRNSKVPRKGAQDTETSSQGKAVYPMIDEVPPLESCRS